MTSTIPTWMNSLNDATIRADVTSAVTAGAFTYNSISKILTDLNAELVSTKSVLTASQLGDLKTVVSDLNNGVSTSSYLTNVFSKLVNGDAANATYTAGAGNPISLGNLAAGSTATQLSELTNKWILGTDLPSTTNPCYVSPGYGSTSMSLYGSKGAVTMDAVNQGVTSDCYFLASAASLAEMAPSLLQSHIVENGNGTWGVEFFVNGQQQWVTVNNAFANYNGSMIFNRGSDASGIWASVIEKAWAELQSSGNITGNSNAPACNSYNAIGQGGYVESALKALTGGTVTDFIGNAISTNLKTIVADLQAQEEVVLSSFTTTYDSNGKQDLFSSHAMTVIGYDSATNMLIIRNPDGTAPNQTWNTTFEVSATTLANTGEDYISVCVNPGAPAPAPVAPTPAPAPTPATSAPTVTAAGASVHGGASVSLLSTLNITGTYADLKFSDPSETAVNLHGATNLLGAAATAAGNYEVSQAQASLVTINGATTVGTNVLNGVAVSADGKTWSSAVNDTLTTVGATITVTSQSVAPGKSVAVSTLFTAADQGGTISQYKIVDPSHEIALNGASNSSTTAGTIIVSAADLAKLTYVGATTAGSETLQVSANDGAWSAATSFTVTTATPIPAQIAGVQQVISKGLTIQASSLVAVADSNPILTYTFTDTTTSYASGNFVLNGTAVANGHSVTVTAAQLGSLTFAGTASGFDNIVISATDVNGTVGSVSTTLGSTPNNTHSTADATSFGANILGGWTASAQPTMMASNWVGGSNPTDMFSFTVQNNLNTAASKTFSSPISIALTGLTDTATVQLCTASSVIASNVGTGTVTLTSTINAYGTYYIQVIDKGNGGNYTLTVVDTTTPITSLSGVSASTPGTYSLAHTTGSAVGLAGQADAGFHLFA